MALPGTTLLHLRAGNPKRYLPIWSTLARFKGETLGLLAEFVLMPRSSGQDLWLGRPYPAPMSLGTRFVIPFDDEESLFFALRDSSSSKGMTHLSSEVGNL